jgi:hypothetical protein
MTHQALGYKDSSSMLYSFSIPSLPSPIASTLLIPLLAIMFAEDTITPELSNAPELSDPDELRDALDSVVAYVILQLYIQITAQHDCSFKKVLQPYRAQARWIAPAIHPFMDLTHAFFAGVPEVGAAEEEEQDGYVVISYLWVETVY